MTTPAPFAIADDEAGRTIAAVLRPRLPGMSWAQVRAIIASRRVKVRAELCMDPARRVKTGDLIEVLERSAPRPKEAGDIVIRHLDDHIVVVEKPSGVNTVRHPVERAWNDERKRLSPTLEDLVPQAIARKTGARPTARLRIVHRLDKETSGLVVFGRNVEAERGLGSQFHAHTVLRRYLALIPGRFESRTIHSVLLRDRGDGKRGSAMEGDDASQGKEATTHVEVVERLIGYTLVACRLETGRTHQIRIHLAEQGRPVCGDKVYCRFRDGSSFIDASGVPRLFLHATRLGFTHPATGEEMHWEMPLPLDLETALGKIRRAGRTGAPE